MLSDDIAPSGGNLDAATVEVRPAPGGTFSVNGASGLVTFTPDPGFWGIVATTSPTAPNSPTTSPAASTNTTASGPTSTPPPESSSPPPTSAEQPRHARTPRPGSRRARPRTHTRAAIEPARSRRTARPRPPNPAPSS
ncbi:hypothetical protein [Candidatus Poriferisodalis sp.]|uniref:hypothetical protein n=1 Tax=Candidatus Poriferisodalis sp. TaxID=3101277 RepID=UPI003B01A30B